MIHLEPGHRIVSETLAAAFLAPADRRESIDVRCCDFGAQYHLAVHPDEKHILRLSLWLRCYAEVEEAVGAAFFGDMYGAMLEPTPQPGSSLTLAINLDALPEGEVAREELVRKLSSVKRDVAGAPLWVCFSALLEGGKPPLPHYTVPFGENECMYVVPQLDVVVVVLSLCFSNATEAALAKSFLQEIEISRRQAKELATAPGVSYSLAPPLELQQLARPTGAAEPGFVGFVSLAINKRIVDGGRLEKALTLVEGYRNYLLYHIKATKSQLHSRIRTRSSNWLQVLNRAVPEKLDKERKTISGRTFKR